MTLDCIRDTLRICLNSPRTFGHVFGVSIHTKTKSFQSQYIQISLSGWLSRHHQAIWNHGFIFYADCEWQLPRYKQRGIELCRVSCRIVPIRLLMCGQTRRSTRNSSPRSKGGMREFAASDRSFRVIQWPMKTWHLLTADMKLAPPRSFQSIFLSSWTKTPVILLSRQGPHFISQLLFPSNPFLHRTSCHDLGPIFYHAFWTICDRRMPNPS